MKNYKDLQPRRREIINKTPTSRFKLDVEKKKNCKSFINIMSVFRSSSLFFLLVILRGVYSGTEPK